jgi:hypothetical protein
MSKEIPVISEFKLGCQWRGVVHRDAVPVETQFQMIRDSGVFDFLDRLPPPDVLDEYIRCSQKYDVPMQTGTWQYMLGRDEPLLQEYMRNAARAGLKMHNIMIYTRAADGHAVTDDEVAECYLRTWELGERIGVQPTFELHVNMWSEEFPRVRRVAETVKARGAPFNLTMDYSHCIFKIENPEEQEVSHIREDIGAGRLVLDPFEPGNLCDEWLAMNIVAFAQFRPAAPNGPRNIWAKDDEGNPGRGIQYPFVKPRPGEWHSPWHAYKLEPSKEALKKVLRHHLTNNRSPLRYVSTEMINLPDYGENAGYSLFEQNVACARWIRESWNQMRAMQQAGLPLLS